MNTVEHYYMPCCREVETVFHEFGHALQHMVTKQAEGLVAGIRWVEWDAVELPFKSSLIMTIMNMTVRRDAGRLMLPSMNVVTPCSTW